MRRLAAAAIAIVAVFASGVSVGRYTKHAPTQIVEKERVVTKWEKQVAVSSAATVAAEKRQTVKVVTRWLRPDGSTSRERTSQADTGTSSRLEVARQTSAASSGEIDRASESRTVEVQRPRFMLSGYLGLDLDRGLARRWGGAAAIRTAGPVWLGVWALPGMRVGGASVGLTF